MTEAYLTIAPEWVAETVSTLGGCGQGKLLAELSRTPLARSEYTSGVGKGRSRLRIDTSHLCRFEGTDFVQWYGRVASGYFVPFGRIMQIVGVPND